MTDLEILESINKNYKQLREWGCSNSKCRYKCTDGIVNAPHVFVNEYEEPSYCCKGQYVLIFDDGIYKKV